MPSNLQTEWKRIGRSGPTIDGRVIEADALIEAAANYDPALYTALIWPEHFRWYNLGKIIGLRSEKNDEDGVDLFAKLSPNQYYLDAVKYGQKLFTSMELLPNFRDTGKFYLTGCAATDSPASAATSEMRFSASDNNALLLSAHSEFTSHNFNDQQDQGDTPPNWFTKIFSKNTEDDMSKESIEKLQTQLAALSDKFNALSKKVAPAANNEGDKGDEQTQDFSALTDSVKKLEERFAAMDAEQKGDAEDEATLQLAAMQTALDDLTAKFTEALQETGGTQAGEDTGGDDLNAYI